ncbi:acetoacetate decarboxylase family protein [Georgenia sp. AZ-5]|uniref:acetoacetate decarboxylase family protein n=1 Tax=Georgenia sp. AZ-5 TaxID=3367526 RepID=UPI0037540E34
MSLLLPPLASSEFRLIPAAAEAALPPDVQLPEDVPPAPWRCTFDGFIWVQRAGVGAAAMLPEPLRAGPRWLMGAHLHYTDTPVGPYSEVFAALLVRVGVRPAAHVPFMAVDELGSVRGGRANWALPKTVARFAGEPAAGGELEAVGPGWRIGTRARPLGPWLPFRAALPHAQVRPDGTVARFTTTVAGQARLAPVEVEVTSGDRLAAWMPPGRHMAVQWRDASLTVTAATRHTP